MRSVVLERTVGLAGELVAGGGHEPLRVWGESGAAELERVLRFARLDCQRGFDSKGGVETRVPLLCDEIELRQQLVRLAGGPVARDSSELYALHGCGGTQPRQTLDLAVDT